MKSRTHGTNTLEAKVTNISKHGFWLYLSGDEFFLPFKKFPWFRKASIEEIIHIELLHQAHLYWPLLDIDLHINTIKNPENFPLVDKKE
ncbi:MAG: DUF2442 domain-containing protein [Bacteroidales bacterium]|nr:DUF2442 domain-containing protein [Bacteroidales bacterium]